ncbi:hypothetical protein AB1Y20_014411 [Prymnesium parvum]|uniref:Proteasome assembly chaperone 1 n=1 Tax=Prymnesium parvum TaxID=97485 RepID=A0AB34IDK9_PRYPA
MTTDVLDPQRTRVTVVIPSSKRSALRDLYLQPDGLLFGASYGGTSGVTALIVRDHLYQLVLNTRIDLLSPYASPSPGSPPAVPPPPPPLAPITVEVRIVIRLPSSECCEEATLASHADTVVVGLAYALREPVSNFVLISYQVLSAGSFVLLRSGDTRRKRQLQEFAEFLLEVRIGIFLIGNDDPEDPLLLTLIALFETRTLSLTYPIEWAQNSLFFIPTGNSSRITLFGVPPPAPQIPPAAPPSYPPFPPTPEAESSGSIAASLAWLVPLAIVAVIVILVLGYYNWRLMLELLADTTCWRAVRGFVGRCCCCCRRRVHPAKHASKPDTHTPQKQRRERPGTETDRETSENADDSDGADSSASAGNGKQAKAKQFGTSMQTPTRARSATHKSPGASAKSIGSRSPRTFGLSRHDSASTDSDASAVGSRPNFKLRRSSSRCYPTDMVAVSYEPPILRDAQYVVDASGRASYRLPPVRAPVCTSSLNSCRFIDQPPPESNRAPYSGVPPPNIGPAPWLGSIPGSTCKLMANTAGMGKNVAEIPPPQTTALARARARGNLSGRPSLTPLDPLPAICRQRMEPREVEARSSDPPSDITSSLRPTAQSHKLDGAPSSTSANSSAARELVLASRARDRIRDRRTARASQEASTNKLCH